MDTKAYTYDFNSPYARATYRNSFRFSSKWCRDIGDHEVDIVLDQFKRECIEEAAKLRFERPHMTELYDECYPYCIDRPMWTLGENGLKIRTWKDAINGPAGIGEYIIIIRDQAVFGKIK